MADVKTHPFELQARQACGDEEISKPAISPQVNLAISSETIESRAMSFRVRLLRVVATFAVAILPSAAVLAQDGLAGEVKALKQLVDQQTKQIETLTAQIARLSARIEGNTEAAPPAAERNAPATPEATEFSIPVARPVAPHAAPNVHIVVKGESLEKIAKLHGTTVPDLQKINRITDPKKLQIGQQLLLPPPTPKKELQ
jgi:LysM repeat protein